MLVFFLTVSTRALQWCRGKCRTQVYMHVYTHLCACLCACCLQWHALPKRVCMDLMCHPRVKAFLPSSLASQNIGSLHACACAVRPNSRAHGTARQDYDRKSVTKTISKFCHRVGFVTKFQFMQACRVLFPQVDRLFNFGWTIEPEL